MDQLLSVVIVLAFALVILVVLLAYVTKAKILDDRHEQVNRDDVTPVTKRVGAYSNEDCVYRHCPNPQICKADKNGCVHLTGVS